MRFVAHLDGYLLLALTLLMLLGLVVLYSATDSDLHRVGSQVVNMVVALGVMWMVANIPPQHLARMGLPVYLVGLLLLVGVALFGEVSHGARRWLHIGVTRIQPSEIMKLAVPLVLAWYFDRHAATLRFKDFMVAALLLLVPIAFIAKQPDLGTALIVSAAGFYVLFLGGLSWRVLLGLAVAGAASLPLLWSMLHDYQRQRVALTLLDPSQDRLGAGYHTLQSTIAMGSGGVFGKGWLHGTQAHLEFLPERHTDFILAVLRAPSGPRASPHRTATLIHLRSKLSLLLALRRHRRPPARPLLPSSASCWRAPGPTARPWGSRSCSSCSPSIGSVERGGRRRNLPGRGALPWRGGQQHARQ